MPTVTFRVPEEWAAQVAPSGWIENEHRTAIIDRINATWEVVEADGDNRIRRRDRWAETDSRNQEWLEEYVETRRNYLEAAEQQLSEDVEWHRERLYLNSTNSVSTVGTGNGTYTHVITPTWTTSASTVAEDIRNTWQHTADRLVSTFRSAIRPWHERLDWEQVDDRDYVTVNGNRVQVYQCDVPGRRLLTPNGWVNESTLQAGFTDDEAYESEQQRIREEAERVARERQQCAIEERRAQQLRREEADAKAKELLEMFLDSDQLATLREHDYFLVVVGENTFRIRPGRTSNVVCTAGPLQGRRFCIHPAENLPYYDQMLLQKAMLEAEPERFLRVANY